MRHRMRGRKLGRNASHRKAMFRNMACSLIKSVTSTGENVGDPRVPGRIVTTEPKAKELRPIIEKLITMARKAMPHAERAQDFATSSARNSDEWKSWRESAQWSDWAQAIAPAVAIRRRLFSILRDNDAVEILMSNIAPRFADRPGGYTRVLRLATVRLGDSGKQALIEFVGNPETDRVKVARRTAPAPVVVDDAPKAEAPEADGGEKTDA